MDQPCSCSSSTSGLEPRRTSSIRAADPEELICPVSGLVPKITLDRIRPPSLPSIPSKTGKMILPCECAEAEPGSAVSSEWRNVSSVHMRKWTKDDLGQADTHRSPDLGLVQSGLMINKTRWLMVFGARTGGGGEELGGG